ncbi:hypothetical protein M378DRAFT_187763 [Amanita muscaria Koide BX008]|uniref:Endosomal/vacuolar adapter protein YPT35 n=1 Tax=Amanita muscaria (strain Koide BX008) TaxID=946122 RepID=A0A0C2WW14_AMAMK|nr:hypothetical protein M378DRAFT_187763 [Amanita muscaria Koide BX008]
MLSLNDELYSPTTPTTIGGPITPTVEHSPFANTTSQIEVIHDHGKIDVEAEMRLYETLVSDSDVDNRSLPPRSISPSHTLSVYSRDIWLEDNTGTSLAFTSDVNIPGWTSVGDQRKGAYIVYDCAIKTKAGIIIHKHKRYNAFAELEIALRRSLPHHLIPSIPPLPPKSPFSRFRPAFLDRRRRYLQYWLSSVLLHPDIGASMAVKTWVMD